MTKNYLIMVGVSSTEGNLTYRLSTYPDNKKVPQTMSVAPGDRLSWHVQVGIGGVPVPLPYTIQFFQPDGSTPDAEFFGVSSLSVPTDGTSPNLHVRALQRSIKYSLSVPGLGVIFDPIIQTGDGQEPDLKDIPGADTYAVTWDIDAKAMTYSVNGGVEQQFPATRLQIKLGDRMGFAAVSALGASQDIQIVFTWDGITNWVSPFFQRTDPIPATAVDPIPPMPVKDPGDHYSSQNGVFPFVLRNSDGTQSSSFNLALA